MRASIKCLHAIKEDRERWCELVSMATLSEFIIMIMMMNSQDNKNLASARQLHTLYV